MQNQTFNQSQESIVNAKPNKKKICPTAIDWISSTGIIFPIYLFVESHLENYLKEHFIRHCLSCIMFSFLS